MICTGRRTNPLFSSLSLSLSSALACSAGLVAGAGGTKPNPSSVTGSCAGPKASGLTLRRRRSLTRKSPAGIRPDPWHRHADWPSKRGVKILLAIIVGTLIPETASAGDAAREFATAVSWSQTADLAAADWVQGLVPRKFVLQTCDTAREELEKVRAKLAESSSANPTTIDEAIVRVELSLGKFEIALRGSDHAAARSAAAALRLAAAELRAAEGASPP